MFPTCTHYKKKLPNVGNYLHTIHGQHGTWFFLPKLDIPSELILGVTWCDQPSWRNRALGKLDYPFGLSKEFTLSKRGGYSGFIHRILHHLTQTSIAPENWCLECFFLFGILLIFTGLLLLVFGRVDALKHVCSSEFCGEMFQFDEFVFCRWVDQTPTRFDRLIFWIWPDGWFLF